MNAFPGLYATRRNGCSIPTQGFAGHGNPIANEAITFTLYDASVEVATFWVPGATYNLAVGVPLPDSVYAWIHASVGTVEALAYGEKAHACVNAWYSDSSAEAHSVQWTAPAVVGTGLCVVFTTSQATGSQAAYSINSVCIILIPGALILIDK